LPLRLGLPPEAKPTLIAQVATGMDKLPGQHLTAVAAENTDEGMTVRDYRVL